MTDKTITSKENLLEVLDLLDSLNIRYWVDGGWGVDILLGKQNRDHRDIDIDFDGKYTEVLLTALKEKGYEVTTDWAPTRIELYHPVLGFIDIHPLVIGDDGSARQADLEGGWYEFNFSWFSQASLDGRVIPCISAEAQALFHSGYDQRDVDITDMENLKPLLR